MLRRVQYERTATDSAYIQDSPKKSTFSETVRNILLIDNTNTPYLTSAAQVTKSNENAEGIVTAPIQHDDVISKKAWLIDCGVREFLSDVDLTANNQIVDKETFHKLNVAQEAIWLAKKLLPYGSPDQFLNLYGTKGEAWARLKINQSRYKKISNDDNDKKAVQIEKIIQHGAGNCGEFSAVVYMLLANLDLNDDIYRVNAKDIDHSFCVIGDLDSCNSIIVDAWPMIPSAHLVSDNLYGIGAAQWVHKKGESFPLSIEDALRIRKTTRRELNDFINRIRNITHEDDYLYWAQNDPLAQHVFHCLFSEQRPITVFKKRGSDETLSFGIPGGYAKKLQQYINECKE